MLARFVIGLFAPVGSYVGVSYLQALKVSREKEGGGSYCIFLFCCCVH